MRASGTRRRVFALTGVLLALSPGAFALNPALDVSQYAHTTWKIRDGFPKDTVGAIAQTPDGYLWLGTQFGLFRFDGVANSAWMPPRDQRLPDDILRSLLAARDGTLWIGTFRGLASWKDGKLTQYAALAGLDVYALLEDRNGTVWAGSLLPTEKLCSIQKGSVQCSAESGRPGGGIQGLYENPKGVLWVHTRDGLWQWKPGPPKFFPVPGDLRTSEGLAEADDGTLLISTPNRLRRLVDGKAEAYTLPGNIPNFHARRLLRDREGGLWIGTAAQGLIHVHHGRTDVFRQSDGLSGDSVQALFEDREGDIWVSTNNGLDRFRDFAVPTYSGSQGLSNSAVMSVLAARDGSLWLSTFDGLKRWNHEEVTSYRGRAHTRPATEEREITGSGLPGHGIESILEDDRERIWVATLDGAGYLENGHFTYIRDLPARVVLAIAEDIGGNIWIADQNLGLFQLSRQGEIQQIPWTRFRREDHASALVADPRQGGIWLGFFRGGVVYFQNGQIRASYAAADGLGEGWVEGLRLDQDGTLWAATNGGLSRVKDGRVSTLSSKNGLPCNRVHWVAEDDSHSSWLYMACGLVRVARSELDAWAADPNHSVQATVFDGSDGVRILARAGTYGPQITRSPDGRLWFTPGDGISVIDPRHLPFNNLPPPVHIEQITANRKRYDATTGMRLPALIRDLQIDYTALSLVAPEKIRFRYKLEGHDTDWQDAGNRRQAFYNDLPPRKYRFRVTACNNNGVWNETGATFDFFIEPAYYQTTWFLVSCAAVFLAMLAGLYRLRLWYVVHQFNMRLDERVGERTRIARDLHDTLLQSFQGVLLKFHAVTYALPDRPAEARKTLESAIEEARQAIADGRDAVQGLRLSTVPTEDLARAIGTLGEGLAASPDGRLSPDFRVQVEGTTRKLAPVVRDEVYRIAGEAMRNAFRHAGAGRIEVDIHYDKRELIVRIRDNGKGIDAKVLDEGGRAGRHGLPGMHERAKLVGGKLAIWSELHSGTEIELTVPASVAYAKPPAASRPPSLGKGNRVNG
ncbi:MAG TPA: two-component regulator propeller domain-containing protein [Candidatus Acidoferrales bacterium]|jgi:signal transduction histidine kinase/ligand-binding sensor domain-containing protein|nr:two-component regulator propeller domain-containing protein [Candidatus Acidoferrales bacterium]